MTMFLLGFHFYRLRLMMTPIPGSRGANEKLLTHLPDELKTGSKDASDIDLGCWLV